MTTWDLYPCPGTPDGCYGTPHFYLAQECKCFPSFGFQFPSLATSRLPICELRNIFIPKIQSSHLTDDPHPFGPSRLSYCGSKLCLLRVGGSPHLSCCRVSTAYVPA